MLAAAPDDETKINLATGACVGRDGPLRKSEEFRHLVTWPQFVQAIKDRFKAKITKEEARRYLTSLQRDKGTQLKDFGAFLRTRIGDLTQELGYDAQQEERFAKQLFCKALPAHIGPYLATDTASLSFRELVQYAEDHIDEDLDAEEARTSPYVNAVSRKVESGQGGNRSGPPQTKAVGSGRPQQPPRNDWWDSRTCFNCGKRGHVKARCRKGRTES